jgi:hypothetical protein
MLDKSNNLIDKINELLAEADNSIDRDFFNSEIENEPSKWDDEETVKFKEQLSEVKIRFEHVDNYGGEDQGSDYWSVYSFTDGMQVVFIKFDGWYASYDGSTYEQFYEVKPVEKTITVFEKK